MVRAATVLLFVERAAGESSTARGRALSASETQLLTGSVFCLRTQHSPSASTACTLVTRVRSTAGAANLARFHIEGDQLADGVRSPISKGDHMKRRLATVTSVAAIAVAVAATPADAGHREDWCGAENMRHAGSHMAYAMTYHTNQHGDDGMNAAVARTGC